MTALSKAVTHGSQLGESVADEAAVASVPKSSGYKN